MLKRKALWKDIFREIWQTRNRFLSIFAIIALGTGFFSGIKTTCPDMKDTAAQYYADTSLMDIRLVSTFGFTQEDVDATRDRDDIREVMPAYSTDVIINKGEENETLVKVMSYQDNILNKPMLLEGRLPEKSGECVVEQARQTPDNFKLGETLSLTSGDPDSALSDTLSTDTYEIVGIVQSSLYIDFERGSTSIGNGSLDSFMLVPDEDFKLDYFTDLFVTLKSTKGIDPFTSEYTELVDSASDELEAFSEERTALRYDDIYQEANDKLTDAKTKLADGKQTQQEELAKAQKELDDAKKQLEDGQAELNSQKASFNDTVATTRQQIADGFVQLDDAQNQLNQKQADYNTAIPDAEQKINDGYAQLDTAQKELDAGKKELEDTLAETQETLRASEAQLTAARIQLEDGLAQLEQARAGLAQLESQAQALEAQIPTLPDDQKPQAEATLAALRSQISQISATISAKEQEAGAAQEQINQGAAQISSGWDQLRGQSTAARQQLEAGQAEINKNRAELDRQYAAFLTEKENGAKQLADAQAEITQKRAELTDQQAAFEEEIQKAPQKFADAQKEIDDGLADYTSGLATFEQEKASSNQEIADAEQEIHDAEKKLRELDHPKWYVFDRTSYPGYDSYGTDAERVDNVAKVFPLFFILVAMLVCLTTMTRMVEEHRTQIGTMKALGYSKGSIVMKYLIYAISASLLGSVTGVLICSKLFPTIIFNAYRSLYIMPDIIAPIRWDYAASSMLVAILCTSLSAFIACYAELFSQPAQLMRPKAPKAGKRVLLEKIPWLWAKFSFIYKVTIRNIFRYKKRVLMTVVGIAGCTALMLTGFGLQYSITSIVPKQFNEIFVYDTIVAVKDDLTQQEKTDFSKELDANEHVSDQTYVIMKNVDASGSHGTKSATLFVPQETDQIDKYVALQERESRKKLTMTDDGVIINEKLGKLLELKAGDQIVLSTDNGGTVSVNITGITENYTMNYIYMTPNLYETTFGEVPDFDTVIINMASPDVKEELSVELISNDKVLGVSFSEDNGRSFKDVVSSLNYIVLVIIISAGALAFVVLYNLVNVNVAERTRELATIKVLGFYDKEVSAYVYRENIFCTILGIAAGLIMGIFLEAFVVATAEVDVVMFTPGINFMSFIYAAVLTLLFTLIVNIVLHFKLKKLDMVESMKSIE